MTHVRQLMKIMALTLLALVTTLSACGAPFTGAGFSEGGGDAGAPAEEATAGNAEAGAAEAGSAGAPAAGAAGAVSASAGSAGTVIVVTAGTGGSPPVAITPPCDNAVEISGGYLGSSLTPAGGECFKTKDAFTAFRMIGCTEKREVRVNGGAALHCTSEPSPAWGSVCTLKTDFSAADAEGYHYLQFGSDEYACGGFWWGNEPPGDPCSNGAFGYSSSKKYQVSDVVQATCVGGGVCEWRCMSESCSGVSSPKAPKWETVRSC